jgi:nitrite reductase/ring-hydroxylating ferredoxin subunit
MATPVGFVRAGTIDELRVRGRIVVRGQHCPLLVVLERGRIFALDNRCPHLGFPLHLGTVEDGILTCHWHHARFDLASGGGFDLWADDVLTAEVRVDNGEVWVRANARHADGEAHWKNRLLAGLEHNLPLVIAKAILGRLAQGAAPAELVREAALFGVRQRDGWSSGVTTLTALANLLPWLPEEETYLALYKGITRVAADCEGAAPRRERRALEASADLDALARWLGHWVRVRHRDGAERTLLSAVRAGAAPGEIAAMMLGAATERAFADGGHTLDFVNKAFECLERIGWEHAAAVLPATVGGLAEARGSEESNSWRHPVDLIALCVDAIAEVPRALAAAAARRGAWYGATPLAHSLLGEDPAAILAAILSAIRDGATGAELGRALACAAALRIARFGTTNEHSDWESAHHAFTHANALHRMLARIEREGRPMSAELLRGVFHGAMRVYLLRFLNVPPARLPGEQDRLEDLPQDAETLRKRFLAVLDRHGAVEEAARLVARYVDLGHERDALLVTLAHAVLREDAGFHAYQMLEAGIGQARDWGHAPQSRSILVALARYLAAHSPTERSELQTATVARKLARGEALHEAPT